MGAKRASVTAVAAVVAGVLLMSLLVTWAASIGPSDVLTGVGIEPGTPRNAVAVPRLPGTDPGELAEQRRQVSLAGAVPDKLLTGTDDPHRHPVPRPDVVLGERGSRRPPGERLGFLAANLLLTRRTG